MAKRPNKVDKDKSQNSEVPIAEEQKDLRLTGDLVLTRLRSMFGADCVHVGAQLWEESPVVPRLPVGHYALDYMIGGGLPLWSVTCFWGDESSDKTTTLAQAVATSQVTCFRCMMPSAVCRCDDGPLLMQTFWCNVEGELDLDRFSTMGIDLSRLVIGEPSTGEAALDAVCLAADVPDCGLIVMDSIAEVAASAQLEDNALLRQKPADAASLFSKWTKKVRPRIHAQKNRHHPMTVLVSNQMREKPGQVFGTPQYQTGGHALKHLFGVTVLFDQVALEKEEKEVFVVNGFRCVNKFNLHLTKNKHEVFQMQGQYLRAQADVPRLGLIKGRVVDRNTLKQAALDHGVLVSTAKDGKGGPYAACGQEFRIQDDFANWAQEDRTNYALVCAAIFEARRKRGVE